MLLVGAGMRSRQPYQDATETGKAAIRRVTKRHKRTGVATPDQRTRSNVAARWGLAGGGSGLSAALLPRGLCRGLGSVGAW